MTNQTSTRSSAVELQIHAEPAMEHQLEGARVLLVQDVDSPQHHAQGLRDAGCTVVLTTANQDELLAIPNDPFGLIIVNLSHCGESMRDLIMERAAAAPHTQLIAVASAEQAVHEITPRPFAVLPAPVPLVTLLTVAHRALRHAELLADNSRLNRQLALRGTREIIGNTQSLNRLRQRIVEIAHSDEATLVQGESGTGKQVISRAIHDCGPRAHRPFLTVDCSVLTAAHLERELFGEACRNQISGGQPYQGRIELAAGGTLVLQNLDEMALALQADVAQVLRDLKYRRIGSDDDRTLETRIIATTRDDLHRLASQGLFREDLFAECSRQTLNAPPLREHRDDVAALTEHFLRNVAMKNGMPPKRIPTQTMELLSCHHWPGNVCELENLIVHACTVDAGPKLSAETVRPWLTTSAEDIEDQPPGMSLREMERKLIESTFARCAGNRERTAQALKIGLRTLSGKLREYGYPPRGGPGSNLPQRRAA